MSCKYCNKVSYLNLKKKEKKKNRKESLMLFLQTLVCEFVLSDVSRSLLLQVMMLRQRDERSIIKQQFLLSDWLTVCQLIPNQGKKV